MHDFVVSYANAEDLFYSAKYPDAAYLARRGRWSLYHAKALAFGSEADAKQALQHVAHRTPEDRKHNLRICRRNYLLVGKTIRLSSIDLVDRP